jgi:hypothetical protein
MQGRAQQRVARGLLILKSHPGNHQRQSQQPGPKTFTRNTLGLYQKLNPSINHNAHSFEPATQPKVPGFLAKEQQLRCKGKGFSRIQVHFLHLSSNT